MWIIAKIKSKQFSLFQEQLNNKFDNKVIYYFPKVFCKSKNFERSKNMLGSYVFCFHEKFKDIKNLVVFQYIKGLEYFLNNCKNSQKEIDEFINLCKNHENSYGFLSQSFFKNIVSKKGQFINGPLSSLVFEIISNEKKYLNILLGNTEMKISKNSNISYLPV